MDTHNTSCSNYQPFSVLPPVDCSLAGPSRALSAAGRYIQYRYRVCADLADLIAVMAGLTGGQS